MNNENTIYKSLRLAKALPGGSSERAWLHGKGSAADHRPSGNQKTGRPKPHTQKEANSEGEHKQPIREKESTGNAQGPEGHFLEDQQKSHLARLRKGKEKTPVTTVRNTRPLLAFQK